MKTYRNYFMTVALMWAGCFILFFFAYMIVLGPQQKSRKQLEDQLTEKKRIYDSALNTAQEETKTRLNEQIKNLQNTLKNFVINFEDSANLTFDISQIASEKKVDSFSIQGKDKPGGSKAPDFKYLLENHLNISFNAGFKQFAAFLNTLERHQPIIFVDNFRISRSKEKNSGHPVNMSLVVLVRKRQDS